MDYRIKEIVTDIESNPRQVQTVKKLAKSVNVSVSYFQHLFKQETNFSFKQYVKKTRLEKARVFLETTHLRVKEIRAKVGATNETHFLRCFKQKFGRTPNEYRKFFRSNDNAAQISEQLPTTETIRK